MPPTPIHPTVGSGVKLGGAAFCCATTGMAHAPASATAMLPATAHPLKVDLVVPPFSVCLSVNTGGYGLYFTLASIRRTGKRDAVRSQLAIQRNCTDAASSSHQRVHDGKVGEAAEIAVH